METFFCCKVSLHPHAIGCFGFDIFNTNDRKNPRGPPNLCHSIIMELGDTTLDAEIESRVRNQMPTQEDVNMQVFSLMLFNKYSPPENSLSGSGFAGTTTSELLTSQINS